MAQLMKFLRLKSLRLSNKAIIPIMSRVAFAAQSVPIFSVSVIIPTFISPVGGIISMAKLAFNRFSESVIHPFVEMFVTYIFFSLSPTRMFGRVFSKKSVPTFSAPVPFSCRECGAGNALKIRMAINYSTSFILRIIFTTKTHTNTFITARVGAILLILQSVFGDGGVFTKVCPTNRADFSKHIYSMYH